MPHSENAYKVAEQITNSLIEAHTLKFVDDFTKLKVRGIIQIILEDNYKLTKLEDKK